MENWLCFEEILFRARENKKKLFECDQLKGLRNSNTKQKSI